MSEKNIFTWDGYYSTYCYYLGQGYIGKVAWEKTEAEYQEKTDGVRKYANYDSFTSVMSKKNKK